MLGECHAHLIMDGLNFWEAVEEHRNGPVDVRIRERLAAYRDKGILFVRDGGDNLGVSARAKELAPEYGIDYRTPIFAIHRKKRYGSIVGKAFSDLGEYHERVLEAKTLGADFIKIMTTGIMDFKTANGITGTPLEEAEVREMVKIAHGEGLAVMSHTNTAEGVIRAVNAGVDSLEHGNFMDEKAIEVLAESDTIWVPTLVTVRNLLGCGRFDDAVIRAIMQGAERNLRLAWKKGARIALGSDAGAYQVLHAQGTLDEYEAFCRILGEEGTAERLGRTEKELKERFRRR